MKSTPTESANTASSTTFRITCAACSGLPSAPSVISPKVSRPSSTVMRGLISASAAVHLDIEVANFFAQGVAVDAEEIGGADLIAARRRQCRGEQRILHFAQDAMIEAGWRQ